MDKLKDAVISSPMIHLIDYSFANEVILAVNLSQITVGFILSQLNDDGCHHPS